MYKIEIVLQLYTVGCTKNVHSALTSTANKSTIDDETCLLIIQTKHCYCITLRIKIEANHFVAIIGKLSAVRRVNQSRSTHSSSCCISMSTGT